MSKIHQPQVATGVYYDPTAAGAASNNVQGALDDLDASVDALETGYNRRRAVINIVDPTAAPPTTTLGDRYILNTTAGVIDPGWDGAARNDIVEYNGATWDAQAPDEGWVAYVDASNLDALFVDDGTPQWQLRAGAPPTGPAGGDLSGTYPDPSVAPLAITDGKVAAANKDGAAGTPSLRTLGTGAQQACAGNDARLSDARPPTSHGTSHNPGGADAATTAAPAAGSLATAAAEGSATSFARSDHQHQANTTPANVTKAAAAIGTSGEPARADHKHDVTTATAGAATPGDTALEGAATSLARSDHRHSLPAFGSGAGNFCEGNDSRLSDARTPTGFAGGDLTGTYPDPTVDANKITNTKLADMPANSVKVRNAGSIGDPSDAAVGDLTEEATPAAGDFLLGWESGGALRKFDVGDLPVHVGAIHLSPIITPTALVAHTHNWAPSGLSTCQVIRASTSGSNYELTGIAAQSNGRLVYLTNVGTSGDIKLKNESASSTAANRFAVDADLTLQCNESAMLFYDGTSARWRVLGAYA